MRTTLLRLTLVGSILALAPIAAQTPPAASPTTDAAVVKSDTPTPPPAVESASLWSVTSALRASVGWRSNVTLSAFHPIDRSFWRAEGESFVLRPIGTDWEFVSFVSGDVLRYFSPPQGVSGEQEWVGHLETRWQPIARLRTSLKADGFIDSTFIDPSETEGAQQLPLWVRVRGGFSTLIPRLSLPGGFALEPSLQVKRITYRGYNGDYHEIRPGARLEWKRSEKLVLSAAWYEHTRHYSELTETTAGNRDLPGWLLSLRQREGELKASTQFDAKGTWNVSVAASRLENRDPAYGFLSYNQRRAVLEAKWSRGSWRVNASADARRLDYLVQKVGIGISRPARITDGYEFTGRIEHDLSAAWMLFLENRWERNRSNVVDDTFNHPFSYRTDTALVGVQRSF